MTVFVSSSPFIDGADRAILNPQNEFVERLQAVLPPNPRVLFVCSNPEDRDGTCRFGADAVSAFAMAGMAFSSFHILDGENQEDAPYLIADSDLIILSGGHVPTQLDFFHQIHLKELLEDYGGTILGISAGSMNMADEVYIQPEEPGESIPAFQRFDEGLGLVNVSILPHYQKARHYTLDGKRLYEDITFADSMGHTFFALPDGSYFFQDEDGLLLCGRAFRIQNSILELLTIDEEVLDMANLI